MNKHLGYGLLYIILLPAALLFGFSALMMLLVALQAPAVLLLAFITACFAIYTITSLVFYIKGIQNNQPCKPSLRDWIRINAFVVVVPAIVLLVESIAVIARPQLLSEAIVQMRTMQEVPFSDEAIISIMKVWFYVVLVYSAALIVHIFFTFRFLKQYQQVFGIYTPEEKEIDHIGEE